MNQNKKDTNIEKLYKRAKRYAGAIFFLIIGVIISAILVEELSDKVELVVTIILLMIMAICLGTLALTIVFLFLTLEKISKEEDKVKENKVRKLVCSDFKEIKIKDTKNFFNTFFKDAKIEAKFDKDNDTIVIVKISMLDEKQNNSFIKEYFFGREDVKSILEEVI